MIAETPEISFLCRIDELTFAKGHEIEMLNTFLIILDHTAAELSLIDNLPDILEDKSIRL